MSAILLDTHYLLWALPEPGLIKASVAAQISSPDVKVYFSAVSIWEIAIKASLGRVDFRHDPSDVFDCALRTGFSELSLGSRVAALVTLLPLHHRDPFDRLLVAQAIALPTRLLTTDAQLARYSEKRSKRLLCLRRSQVSSHGWKTENC
jgi:PIN domain nuclease of toxin-antitoxin system